jgi:hypothetical protein
MAVIDPERGRQRLTELYCGETDAKLETVASQAYELSDLARELLQAELVKRGLNAPLVQYPPGDEVEFRDIVTLRKFRDLPEALLAKGSLDSAGIDCQLVDDNVVRLDWLWSNLMGGVKLLVDREDAEAAEETLSQPIPESFTAADAGEYQRPHCPACQSLDVSFRELNKPVAYVSAYLGVPLPVHRRAWRCHSCKVEWEDDGVPAPDSST